MTARSSQRSSVGRSTVVQWLARGIGLALSFISLVIVAHSLGATEYGRLTVVNAYVIFVIVMADWGFPATLGRELSRDGAVSPALLPTIVIGRLAASVVIYTAALAGFWLLVGQGSATVTAAAIMLLALVPAGVTSSLAPVLQAQMRMHTAALCELAARTAGFIATVAAATSGGSVATLVAIQVAVFAINAVMVFLIVQNRITMSWRFDPAVFLSIMRAAAPLGVAMVINAVYYRIDAVMVTNIQGLQEAGQYGAAYRVMESVVVLPSILAAVVFPVMVRRGPDRIRFRRLVSDCLLAAQAVMVPAALAVMAAAAPIMRLVGGQEFAGGDNALQVLMLAGMASSVCIVLGLALIAIDRNKQALWLNAVALMVNVGVNLMLIPHWGASGAAFATFASETGVAFCSLAMLERWTGGTLGRFRSSLQLMPLVACCVSFAVGWQVAGSAAGAGLALLAFTTAAVAGRGWSWSMVRGAARAPSPTLRRALAGLS